MKNLSQFHLVRNDGMLFRIPLFWLMLVTMLVLNGLVGAQITDEMTGMNEQEVELASDSPCRATGVVMGPEGPAEGVTVMLELIDMGVRRQYAYLQAHTDSQGYFSIDLSAYERPRIAIQFNTVSVRYIESMQIVETAWNELPLYVELHVQPGTLARGVVRDEDGNPLEGVQVYGTNVRQQESNEDGEWESFGLRPGLQRLDFYKEGYAKEFLNIESQGPEVLEGFEVTMVSARKFSGRVINWGENPVPFALVYLTVGEKFQQQVADENGEFVFKGVPEHLEGGKLQAMAEGYLPTEQELTEDDIDAQMATLVIDHGVMVEGEVTLPSGAAASGAKVIAGDEYNRGMPQVYTDTKGQWKLGPFPIGEEYRFTAMPPSSDGSWGVADVVLREGKTPNVYKGDVELWPKGFSSTFTATVNGGTVTLERQDQGNGGFGGTVIYTAEWDGESNEMQGTVEIAEMKQKGAFTMKRHYLMGGGMAGEWELREQIEPSQLNVAPVQETLKMGTITGTMLMDFQLDEALAISGRVIRADGKPFLDGIVYLLGWNDSNVYTVEVPIGINGRFEMGRVPQGIFMLLAVSGDGERQTVPFYARGGIGGVELLEVDEGDPVDL